MAASGGHWKSLAEAQKLTQSRLISGIIEEDINIGGLMGLLPVWQLVGKDLIFNREKTGQTASLAQVGTQLSWTDAVEYDQITRVLKQVYVQTPLDKFVAQVYGSINNYEAIQLMENKKAVIKKVNDLLVYGDTTYSSGNLEPDGIHALAEQAAANFAGTADAMDIDQAEGALSLNNMRKLSDEMKHGIDFWLIPREVGRRIDAYAQENGVSTFTAGNITFTLDQLGQRVTHWDGVPLIRTDYLVAEQANTGVGSDARAKNTSGTKMFSIFAVRRGVPALLQPGLCYVFGGDMRGDGDMMRVERFDKLEDYDAAGLRIVSYLGLADGSAMAIGRIHDITDVAVVV